LTLNTTVAGISLGLALLALFLSIFVVYRTRPQTATDPDPFRSIPIIGPFVWFFAILPLNTLYSRFLIPIFNAASRFMANTLDWDIWHNVFHEEIVRNGFLSLADFSNRGVDVKVIDGLVNFSGRFTSWLADRIRASQTGFVRNYALGVFIGVVALVLYFILSNN
jgi:NADH:ubiquinone oxidoreductase subunit 5 (subunit L)/multisubunit Na+/H+ antiporter MnhA subunit